MRPTTLIRLGRFDSDLGERMRDYPPCFFPIQDPWEEAKIYALFYQPSPSYMIFISQRKNSVPHPYIGHNVLLSVTGRNEKRNLQVLEQVEKVLGTKLNIPVPRYFSTGEDIWNLLFESMEHDPVSSMKALAGK